MYKNKTQNAIKEIKKKLPDIEIKLNEPLKNHTSFKIGGQVNAMFFPVNTGSLTEICEILYKNDIDPLIIGNGSNILATDANLDISVINTSKCNIVSIQNTTDEDYKEIDAMSGVKLNELAVFAYENSLTGFEFAHGIPGTIGGAIVMNAGAYGREMKDVVTGTVAYNPQKGMYGLTAESNEFSYRSSRYTKTGDIVLSATIRLSKSDKKSIKQKMDELSDKRSKSQPLDLPSAGSTFKRPENGYAADLIERSGLKGYTYGGAMVSEKHAGFVVNNNNATYDDVLYVISHVQKVVLKEFKIFLEPEVKIIEPKLK